MILISYAYEYSSSTWQPACEHVDRSYPQFAQSSGQLLTGDYYLLNSSLLSPDTTSCSELVLMRIDQLGKATKEAIGEIGSARFNNFLTYEAGWDGGDAKPLSLESVAMIEIFVSRFKSFATEPSLFLTRKGNLKLSWEDSTGGAIEVELMPGTFKYFIEKRNDEGNVKLAELKKLIDKIHSTEDAAAAA